MRVSGREKFKKFKTIFLILIFINKFFPKTLNASLLRFFRHTNGIIGIVIRFILVKNLAKSCGDNVSIQPGVYFFNLHRITFGNNISIHPMCYIDGNGEIVIGDNVSIAHSTSIISTNHTWDLTDLPIKYNPETKKKVLINEDVWIGCGCRILAGAEIGSRSVIAAGAVVNKSLAGQALYGGIPAKEIKKIE